MEYTIFLRFQIRIFDIEKNLYFKSLPLSNCYIMSLSSFKQKEIGKINQKIKDKRKYILYAAFSIIGALILIIASLFVVEKHKIGGTILIIVIMSIWSVIWFKLINKIDSAQISNKEKTLLMLCKGIQHLRDYVKTKSPKDFRNGLKHLNKSMKIIDNIYFDTFGTEWEEKTNEFFFELYEYMNVKIIPKLKMKENDQKLREILKELERIFEALHKDNYTELHRKLEEINDTHRKQKRSIWERYKIDKDSVVGLFQGTIIIIVSFLGYWGFTIWQNTNFSVVHGISASLGVTVALYYAIRIRKEVKRQ